MNEYMSNRSNITKEQAEKIMADHKQKQQERAEQAEKTAKCSVCGARRERERVMSRFEADIVTHLRNQRFIRLDSCITCVQKHVGTAMQYYAEMLKAIDSGKPDGTARIDIKRNHLKVIGELNCAIDESAEYTDLQTALISAERAYRYEGIEPEWDTIAALIIEYEDAIAASGANK